MSELEEFRDHARHMADFEPSSSNSSKGWFCQTSRWKPHAEHEKCETLRCRCSCHAPKDQDRAVWTRLANEVDGYLENHLDDALEGL